MEGRWAAFPGRAGEEQEKAEITGFRGFPDQFISSVRPSAVKHEEKSIFNPLSVNSSSASYYFDTGAW
jgi:hypothetical protein